MNQNQQKNPILRRKNRIRTVRIFVQIFFFVTMPALFSQAFGGVKEIFCAIGEAEALSVSTFLVRLLLLCGLTILFGRIFCGWACAFGAFSDWLYLVFGAIAKRMGIKRRKGIPEKIAQRLTGLKYLVLVGVIALCVFGHNDWITKYSPWTVFSLLTARHFSLGGYLIAALLLLVLSVCMGMEERFFCRFLCPMGAVFSLLPELPLFKLKRKKEACADGCSLCKRDCPAGLKLGEEPMREGECIRCMRCSAGCPRRNITI